MAVSANWLHSPSRLCHREGAFTQFTFQNGQESRKWLTIQICHVLNAWEAKKPLYGTKNLSKGAKTRVRVLADIQNFALRAHCVRTACMAFLLCVHRLVYTPPCVWTAKPSLRLTALNTKFVDCLVWIRSEESCKVWRVSKMAMGGESAHDDRRTNPPPPTQLLDARCGG